MNVAVDDYPLFPLRPTFERLPCLHGGGCLSDFFRFFRFCFFVMCLFFTIFLPKGPGTDPRAIDIIRRGVAEGR